MLKRSVLADLQDPEEAREENLQLGQGMIQEQETVEAVDDKGNHKGIVTGQEQDRWLSRSNEGV